METAIKVDIEKLKPLCKEMEEELTTVLTKYYNKSPYERYLVGFHVYSWAYQIQVSLLVKPDNLQ